MLSDLAVERMEREAAHTWATIIASQGLDKLRHMTEAQRLAAIKDALGFDDAEVLKIDGALLDMIDHDAPPAMPVRKRGRDAMWR